MSNRFTLYDVRQREDWIIMKIVIKRRNARRLDYYGNIKAKARAPKGWTQNKRSFS